MTVAELSRVADPWDLRVAFAGGGLVVCSIGPVCAAIWRTKPIPSLFEMQRRQLAAAVERAPGNAAFLCVVEAAADPPEQELRDASAAMIASHGKKLAACACVIEGAGFRAAITRTVLTGISLVARTQTPTRFFEHVSAASAWVGDRLGRRDSILAEQVELARQRLATAP
jgi:hypothetical protein